MKYKEKIKKITENLSRISRSAKFKKVITILAILIWTILIFQAGMFVGFKKASFFFRYGDDSYKGFRGEHRFPLGMRDNDMPRSHGAIGKIVQISSPTFVISDNDGTEKTILFNTETIIKKYDTSTTASDLKVGDFVVIIGTPNVSSEIEAKLIRLVPADFIGRNK